MPTFDAAAEHYDRSRNAMIPDFDKLYGTAVDVLPFGREDRVRLLDLGAGTGALAEIVAQHYPQAEIVLNDVSVEMLQKARARFAHEPRFSFLEADMEKDNLGEDYDAVVSSLAIHHLEHSAKRAVFARIFDALKPGGLFINIDQFEARSAEIHARLFDNWLRDARSGGALEEDLQAGMTRMRAHDRNAPMQDQFDWLEAAGFIQVDILYRNYYWAVFHAQKPH